MNLAEIIANVNGELLPASNIDVLIKKWANRAQKRFVSMTQHEFSWLKLNRLILNTVALQNEYVISPLIDLSKVISFYQEGIIRRKLFVISRDIFQERFPDPTQITSDPRIAYLSSYSAVQAQPSSASVLTVVSTEVTEDAVIKFEGLNENGVLIGEEVILNGTTPVLTNNQFTKILGRGINNFTIGIITIISNAGAVTNDTVQPRNRQNKYALFTFYPTPGGAGEILYDGTMKLPELVSDNDMSLIPEQYHDAIEDYCLYRGFRHKKDTQGEQSALASFGRRVQEAVLDDKSPSTKIIVGSDFHNHREDFLGTGTLPGLFPCN